MAKNPRADARVLVVWFRMYPGDAISRWPREIFTDRRVEQRWDEPKVAGRWFLEHLGELKPLHGDGVFPQRVDALWDSYLVFDRDATWDATPNRVLSWGYPIMRTKDQLARDFEEAARSRR